MKRFFLKPAILLIAVLFGGAVNAQNSIDLDGNNDYVTAPNTSLNMLNPYEFCFEAWVKGTESLQGPHPMIFANRSMPGYAGVMFGFHKAWGGTPFKMLMVQIGARNYFVPNNGTFGAPILDGTCHHVAVSREYDVLIFFVDGVEIGTRYISGPTLPTTYSSAPDIWIGRDPLSTTFTQFEGMISEVRIWDRTRLAGEISTEMFVNLPSVYPNLVSYWKFQSPSGQLVVDKTGVANGFLGSTPIVDISDPIRLFSSCIASVRMVLEEGSVEENDQTISEIDSDLSKEINNFTLSIYPNPSSDLITIALNKPTSLMNITISDLSGRIVYQINIQDKTELKIDISNLPNGVYFLKADLAEGQQLMKKLIKNN